MSQTLQVGPVQFAFGHRTYIMGILNVTPDSFAGDGATELDIAVARGRKLIAEGADLIDVGGESSRPGAVSVSADEELRRVIPVVERLAGDCGAVVSVDTTKAEVARHALRAGAAMVNDVSALRADPGMTSVIAETGVPVVLMHARSQPPRQASGTADIMAEIQSFLAERMEVAIAGGIPRERFLIDPGFGFGKTVEENLDLLRRLGDLRTLGRPIVIGTSRKGTIGKVLGGLPVTERLEGTAATVAVAITQGADIIRVHDVAVMVRVARMTDAIVRGR